MRETDDYAAAAEWLAATSLDGELHVVSPMYPAQADDLLAALVAATGRQGIRLRLYAADLSGRYGFLPSVPEHVRLVTIGGRVPARLSGDVDFLPTTLYEIARAFADDLIRVDAFVAQVAAPDPSGHCSLGPIVSYSPAAIAAATTVVLEVNEAVPAIPGYVGPSLDECAILVRAGAVEVGELRPKPPEDVHRRIGAFLADLIPDGATLQFGIGGVPEAFLPQLRDHRGLRIHSGAIPESAMELIASGAVADSDRLTTSLLGTRRLYEWAADSPNRVRVEPVTVTHAPSALAGLSDFYAINSAFEVDLTGQVNAETVDGRKRASAGGQSDFGRWAHHSSRGNLIALTSRRPDGRPTIVDELSSPCSVTTHRSDLDYVVTEFGVADLRGRSLAERAKALLAISGR